MMTMNHAESGGHLGVIAGGGEYSSGKWVGIWMWVLSLYRLFVDWVEWTENLAYETDMGGLVMSCKDGVGCPNLSKRHHFPWVYLWKGRWWSWHLCYIKSRLGHHSCPPTRYKIHFCHFDSMVMVAVLPTNCPKAPNTWTMVIINNYQLYRQQ